MLAKLRRFIKKAATIIEGGVIAAGIVLAIITVVGQLSTILTK
jgi:Flp pilus assembly pilin Flp